jgi:fibronectin-binding autotransporter adhesin
LNGPSAGTGYSQLNVNGPVDIEGCSLVTSLGFTPANSESFTIIKSTAPIVGAFDGLPEGASVTIGDTPFTISYHGNQGNDVVLTQSIPPTPIVTGLSPNSGPAAGGTLVTISGIGFSHATGVDFGTSAAETLS